MSQALDIAVKYFELSNKSSLDEIENLFSDTSTYKSQNTGAYVGAANIMKMQKEFHGRFCKLHWKVNHAEEVEPGTVLFDYNFDATTTDGEDIHSSGFEHITVRDGIIQHIEIQKNL